MKKLIKAQKKNEQSLLKKKNVCSVGVGFRYKNGVKTEEKCISIGVTKKESLKDLKVDDIVPGVINNQPTDIVVLGNIKALKMGCTQKIQCKPQIIDIDPKAKYRPIFPGISIGHELISAGTLGLIVYKNGSPRILSNNHVLSNSNEAYLGDEILQPGPYDDSEDLDDLIGYLDDYIPIQFDGYPPPESPSEKPTEPTPEPPVNPPEEDKGSSCFLSKIFTKSVNKVLKLSGRKTRILAVTPNQILENTTDCAIATPIVAINKEVPEIGIPQGTKNAELGMKVQKYGRTTQYTTGEVIQLNATVTVDYGGKTATFKNQIITTAMSQGGDSGSAVLDMNNKVVGLLFSGSELVTIHNPIQEVFSKLGVSL